MPNVKQLQQEICELGNRLYTRGLVSGNDGNLSVRLAENEVLCTPTQICKGTMTPDDLCIVDMHGRQLSGNRPRTSEILLHLAILRARPDIQAVVHAHPPHATAFAVTGQPVPRGVTAEAELFLGEVPIALYETPGSAAFAETVLPFVAKTNVCLLAHHGSVTYADSLQQAHCLTEMLEAYCQTILLAQQLAPPPLKTLPAEKLAELQEIKTRLGLHSPQQENENQ